MRSTSDLIFSVLLVGSLSLSEAGKEVITHKNLSPQVKQSVKELRKVTHQIEDISVKHGASLLRWDSLCSSHSLLQGTPACYKLSPRIWFEPFFPNTDKFFVRADENEGSAEEPNQSEDIRAMCVEKDGPCAKFDKKNKASSDIFRDLAGLNQDHSCRTCMQQSYEASMKSVQGHVISHLRNTVVTLQALDTNETAFAELATQRAERISSHLLPLLLNGVGDLYQHHVARTAEQQQQLLGKPTLEELVASQSTDPFNVVAFVTACCSEVVTQDAATLSSIMTSFFVNFLANSSAAILAFAALIGWQMSKTSTKGTSTEPNEKEMALRTLSNHLGPSMREWKHQRAQTCAAKSIQTTWRERRRDIPTFVEQRPYATTPLRLREDGSATSQDSLPELVPQQMSPRLVGADSKKGSSRGIARWVFLLLIFIVGAAAAAYYANEQDYFADEWYVMPRETTKSFNEIVDGLYTRTFGTSTTRSLVVPEVPKQKKASSWSNPTKLGGAYGPILPFN